MVYNPFLVCYSYNGRFIKCIFVIGDFFDLFKKFKLISFFFCSYLNNYYSILTHFAQLGFKGFHQI